MPAIRKQDQRRHKRIYRKLVLRVAENGSNCPPEWSIVASQNFSGGGVLFTFDRPLEKGTSLLFMIHFPDRSFNCHGTALRSSPGFQAPLVNVAATIEGLTKKEMDFIESHGN